MKVILKFIPKIFPHTFFVIVFIAFTGLCLVGLNSCTPLKPRTEKIYWISPTVLPSVRPEMKIPGFWIGRLAEPDRIILDKQEICALNQDIQNRLDLTKDISGLPEAFDGRELLSDIKHWLFRFRDSGHYYRDDSRPAKPGFYTDLEQRMNLAAIQPRMRLKWGLVTTHTDQRLLPTLTPLYREAGDIYFDRLQNNRLDIGTPVAVLHQSDDAQWFWVMGPTSDGWVKADHVALCLRETLENIKNAAFVTVVRDNASLYQNRTLTQYAGFARMGTRFMLIGTSKSDPVAVMLPYRQKTGQLEMLNGYIKAGEIVQGSLAYTPRNIIEQAFEMLNAPYGWGGAHGDQDCSQFIQSIFSTVGIQLPRNSAGQARVGRDLVTFEAIDPDRERLAMMISSGLPGTTILYMKGHVMLYLGDVMGHPYIIHELWAYLEPGIIDDRIRATNRVVITDLELGKGTGRGSLLQRLKTMRGVFN